MAYVRVDWVAQLDGFTRIFNGINTANSGVISGCRIDVDDETLSKITDATAFLAKAETVNTGNKQHCLQTIRKLNALLVVEEFPAGAMCFADAVQAASPQLNTRVGLLEQLGQLVEKVRKVDEELVSAGFEDALLILGGDAPEMRVSKPALLACKCCARLFPKPKWLQWTAPALLADASGALSAQQLSNFSQAVARLAGIDKRSAEICVEMLHEAGVPVEAAGAKETPLERARRDAADLRRRQIVLGRDPTSREAFEAQIAALETAQCTCVKRRARTLLQAVDQGCARCCVNLIRQAGSPQKPIHLVRAVERGDADIVAMLLRDQFESASATINSLLETAHTNNSIRVLSLLQRSVREHPSALPADSAAPQISACRCGKQAKSLFQAAELGCVRCCSLFLDAGNEAGSPALNRAAELNRTDVVLFLKDKLPAQTDREKRSALMVAAARGSVEMCRILAPVQAGMKDAAGETALMAAVRGRNYQAASFLVQHEKCAQNTAGETALMIAVAVRNDEAAQLLAGMEAGVVGVNGDCALRRSLESFRFDYAAILAWSQEEREAIPDLTDLMAACLQEDVNHAQAFLFQAGAVLWNGVTALMLACGTGSLGCAQLLKDAENSIQTAEGVTAYDAAVFCGQTSLESFVSTGGKDVQGEREESLWKMAASLHCSCGNASKTLRLAVKNGCLRCCAAFKERLMTQNSQEWNELAYAAFHGYSDVARLFLAKQADLHFGDDYTTPLMLAARRGNVGCLRVLLAAQARKTDAHANSAMIYAAEHGQLECVRVLVAKEAGVKNREGKSARDIANLAGFMEIYDYLSAFRDEW